MADTKLSALTELATTPANDDEVYIRDVSEAAANESKRITISNLLAGGLAPQAHKDSHDPNDGSDALDCAAAGEIAGVAAAAEGTAHSFARSDHTHQVQHAITDNHILTVDGSPNDDEFARFTANGIEGLTKDETNDALGSRYFYINFIIDGGGSAITTGIKGDVMVPAGTIVEVTTLADQSGDIVVDIWKDTYTNFAPTDADSITASAPPTLSSASKAQDNTLTGWTTSLSDEDILRFNVDSVATVERVTIVLKVER